MKYSSEGTVFTVEQGIDIAHMMHYLITSCRMYKCPNLEYLWYIGSAVDCTYTLNGVFI